MKFIFISIKIIFIYFISFSSSYSIEAPNIKNLIIYEEKQKIKFFDFLNEAGNKVNLKEFKSELIILKFWATWCAPCREEMPSLDKLQNLKILNNLKVIPINVGQEKIEKSVDFFSELNIKNLELYFDNTIKLAKTFSLRGLPTTIIVNKEGEEFARIVGSIDFNSKEFLNWLNKLN